MVPRMPRPSTKGLSLAVVTVAAALAGCAALVTPLPLADMLMPIQRAISTDAERLNQEAAAGDAQAQLALSIALAYGLGGRAVQPAEAAVWRSRALSARTYQPITQYTAAFNGQPSRVNIINIPQPAITPLQVKNIDRCLAVLTERISDAVACGDDDEGARLRSDWASASVR